MHTMLQKKQRTKRHERFACNALGMDGYRQRLGKHNTSSHVRVYQHQRKRLKVKVDIPFTISFPILLHSVTVPAYTRMSAAYKQLTLRCQWTVHVHIIQLCQQGMCVCTWAKTKTFAAMVFASHLSIISILFLLALSSLCCESKCRLEAGKNQCLCAHSVSTSVLAFANGRTANQRFARCGKLSG